MKYLVVVIKTAQTVVEAETEDGAIRLALNEVDPDFLSWLDAVGSVSGAPKDAEYSRLIADPRSLAEEAGWLECPDGRWWREPKAGETLPAERVAPFLGSGPFVWADSAEDACEFDELEQS